MSFKDLLTPKDTEEIKPNLFVQKKGDGYRVLNPLVWNGQWRLKNQFSVRNFVSIAIILFIAWSYVHDNSALLDFYNQVHENPVAFCTQVINDLATPECTPFQEEAGLCNIGIDIITINNGSSDSLF